MTLQVQPPAFYVLELASMAVLLIHSCLVMAGCAATQVTLDF